MDSSISDEITEMKTTIGYRNQNDLCEFIFDFYRLLDLDLPGIYLQQVLSIEKNEMANLLILVIH
ncbi:15795_t:CDS:2 [Funneliformis caledonium]|uniref:15795_t:CDS:1 n=1 Tax=Funneliformis caledonium TaxID=1117310 RepID=A0A9N9CVM1_9GLOM|nr:15795_t:CDS:2 [Funneliformis caledonium]